MLKNLQVTKSNLTAHIIPFGPILILASVHSLFKRNKIELKNKVKK